MKRYKADLHVHTLLSPCGSLEMSPVNIINAALKAKLDIIAITDHNSTKQAPLIRRMAAKQGLTVFLGAEINSMEEVHCLTLFETEEQRVEFQFFIDQHLQPVLNRPDYFGDQVVVDEHEMIVEEEKYLLINALNVGLIEIEQKVHALKGIVIPAHVDRPYNGLFSQLGIMPENLKTDAMELSRNADSTDWKKSHRIPEGMTVVFNSDAHVPEDIGSDFTDFVMKAPDFNELKLALAGKYGRKTLNERMIT